MGKPLNQDDPKVLVKSDGVALPHVVVDVSGDSQSGMLQALATDRQVSVACAYIAAQYCKNISDPIILPGTVHATSIGSPQP